MTASCWMPPRLSKLPTQPATRSRFALPCRRSEAALRGQAQAAEAVASAPKRRAKSGCSARGCCSRCDGSCSLHARCSLPRRRRHAAVAPVTHNARCWPARGAAPAGTHRPPALRQSRTKLARTGSLRLPLADAPMHARPESRRPRPRCPPLASDWASLAKRCAPLRCSSQAPSAPSVRRQQMGLWVGGQQVLCADQRLHSQAQRRCCQVLQHAGPEDRVRGPARVRRGRRPWPLPPG